MTMNIKKKELFNSNLFDFDLEKKNQKNNITIECYFDLKISFEEIALNFEIPS